MSNTAQQSTRSFPFLGILALIFITLKLTGHIDWTWFWVLSPLIIPFALATFILSVAAILFGLADDDRVGSVVYYVLSGVGFVVTLVLTFGLYTWLG